MQEKGEDRSMAQHQSLSTLFDCFGTPKDFSFWKKILFYELSFEIPNNVHGDLRPK